MLNKVMIIGNLGKAPEMRYLPSGKAVTEFSVATSRSWTKDDEKREETEWFNVVCWAKLAEICAQYLDKGRQVYVEGHMETRSWDGECGKKHYRTELVADTVKFLGGNKDGGGDVTTQRAEPAGDVAADEPDDLPF